MICSLRIPDVLQAMIDQASKDEGRSKWILEACRMRLKCGNSLTVERRNIMSEDSVLNPETCPKEYKAVVNDVKANLAALRSIPGIYRMADMVDGRVPPPPDVESVRTTDAEIPICGIDWWEEGEHYECLMDRGHKSTKHGQHGMARNITD